MSETRTQHHYEIVPATEADVVGIGVAHLASTKEAYLNPAIGITDEWMDHAWGKFAEESGNQHRRGTIAEAQQDPDHVLYLAARDRGGEVVGFVHATKTDKLARLEGLYLLSSAHGSGLADQMMEQAVEFAGNLPIELEVVTYNDRAINFYKKHGFELVPGKQGVIKERLPVYAMRKEADQGVTDEV